LRKDPEKTRLLTTMSVCLLPSEIARLILGTSIFIYKKIYLTIARFMKFYDRIDYKTSVDHGPSLQRYCTWSISPCDPASNVLTRPGYF
jgi:hypothetical protein